LADQVFINDTWLLNPPYNLCTTYVLPLIGFNKWSFGTLNDNYVNSFVSEDDKYVIVKLRNKIPNALTETPRYQFGFSKDGFYHAVFTIPEKFLADIKLWREGKYSQLSDDCKWMIRKKSGLKYYMPYAKGGAEVAVELLVLDKDESLRRGMEEYLGEKIDPKAELGSIPGEDNFYTLNLSAKLGIDE
jgi:hypothetical protein